MNVPDNVRAHHEASVEIAAAPQTVYALVSDLTRMGEWSPENLGGSWVGEGGGQVGDWFEGHNEAPGRAWTRRSQVAVADSPQEFTFVTGGIEANCTWWSYVLEPIASGTKLTERWWVVNLTPAMKEATEEDRQARFDATPVMLRATLAALKATAEASSTSQ